MKNAWKEGKEEEEKESRFREERCCNWSRRVTGNGSS